MTTLSEAGDETAITEITVRPDGRVYVFGTSREVLEILGELDPHSARVALLLERLRETKAKAARP